MSVMVVLRGGGAGGRSARQLSRGKYLGTSGTQMLILFLKNTFLIPFSALVMLVRGTERASSLQKFTPIIIHCETLVNQFKGFIFHVNVPYPSVFFLFWKRTSQISGIMHHAVKTWPCLWV